MGWSHSCSIFLLAFLAVRLHVSEAGRECYGSVGGANGHIYQFDGGRVSTFPRGCCFLLARSEIRACRFEIFGSFGSSKSKGSHGHRVSRLRALTVKVGGKKYRLLSRRRLSVNGKPVNVPHSEHGIRVFYSGEDLVLVHKKFHFWVTYDGHWTGTFRLGSKYRKRVSGLAGNCDGRRHNDRFGHLAKAYKMWKRKGWIHKCKPHYKAQKCHGVKERREAAKACRKVIRGRGRCSSLDVLQPCVIDYCSTRYRPDVRKKVLCANFYLHSRRCARHHHPLAWRHKSGCPMKCGRHQHFSRKANPCPKTCENHFFGTKRHCFKLPVPEGCRCNKGFVLDGSLCVRPKHCVCLAKLCIDRVSRSKCRRWKAQGRCRNYPEVMSRFCRLTCGMCRPRCRNQISTALCKQLKRRGKCRKTFYRMMCQVTCQPKKCGCPPKRRVRSKCLSKYKNRAITTMHWFPDAAGRCKKSILVRFYPCGLCRYKRKTLWGKCNYCKGVQLGRLLLQYREKHGKRRCIRKVRSVSKKCHCPPPGKRKRVSYIRCLGNVLTVRITKTYLPVNRCRRCAMITKRNVLRKLNCRGYFYTGKCMGSLVHITRRKFQRYAHSCRCRSKLVQRRRVMCRCPKQISKTVCKGNHFLTTITSWKLKAGRCMRHSQRRKRYLRCKRRHRSWKTCQRRGCKAYRHTSYFHVRKCKCKKHSTRRYLGKCCCPRGSRRFVRINKYWKKLVQVIYVLRRYRCHRGVIVKMIRVACPSSRRYVKCDRRRGVLIHMKQWYVKKGNSCIKKQSERRAKVKCRRDIKQTKGNCHILHGNVRYRRVEFQLYKRRPGTCVCMKVKRVVKEMCGCRAGKHTRLTRCPRGCTTKRCGRHCFFSKEFYYYKARGKRCRVHVFKRLHFRCCCRPDRRVRKWCRNGRVSMREISYSVLRAHKCHRVKNRSSKRVSCLEGTTTKRLRHPKKGFYYEATYRRYVSNCKCRVRVTKRVCKSYCRKPTKRRFCDPVRRHWVTRWVRWSLHGCKRCVPCVSDQRVPVRCSRSVRRWKHCNKKTGVLILYKQWWYQKGCKCTSRKSSTRLRCRCPKPVVGRRYCNAGRNAFEKRILYWVLSRGRCLRRRRIHSSKVKCSRRTRTRSVCKHKNGVKVVYIGIMRPKKCKCVRVWSVHNRRHRCNCNRENKRVKGVVRRYCDRRRNLKVAERYYYVLLRGKCVKRSRRSHHSFRCPNAYIEKKKCNEARHKQLALKHYTIKRNCRCMRLVKRYYIKCGCYGKKMTRRRICKKLSGTIVITLITKRWSNKRHQCVTKKTRTSHQVLCRMKTRYINGKCMKNSFYIETKIFYVRKGCTCVRRQNKRRRNCHCKNIVRRYKCPRHSFTRRVVTEIRRWDMKRRRCRIRRYATRHIRCRCPKEFHRRYCKAGHWVKKTTRFILRKARCYKKVTRNSRLVHCRRVVRHRFEACRGCHRFHYVLERRLHPGRCACYFAVVKKHRCPCCCPKDTSKRHCARDDKWVHVFTHHAALTGHKCGCRRWTTRRPERVRCPTRKVYKWRRCNRRSCISHQQVTYHIAKRCKCLRKQRLTGRKRVCCCRTRPRSNHFCKASSIYKRRVYYQLKNWRCVRRTSVRFIRRWRCNRKPVTKFGRCNRVTCRQSVHSLFSVVARPRCRCRMVVRNRHTRPCCCLKRPHRNTKCQRNCRVTTSTIFSFNRRLRVCVSHRSRTRRCVRCPKADRKVGRCNRRSCRIRITHVSYSLRKCQCKRRIDFSYRVCCCPKPSVSGPVCRRHRQKVWRHISWHLKNGRCMRRVKETQKLVICRRGVTRELTCNRRTCRQRIRHETIRIKNCRCHSYWRESQRTCCCRPSRITRTRCERHRFLYRYTTTRILNRRRRCVSKTKKHLINQVRNCRTSEKRSHCNRLTRHVTVRVFHRKPKQCRCQVYRKSVRRVLCRCPSPRVQRAKCNKTSCHLKQVRMWFTSHGKGDHFRCRRHIQVKHLRCCCKRRPTQRTFCDKRTGAIKRLNKWKVFHGRSRSCITRSSVKTVKRLVCPRSKCAFGKCNKKTGYKLRVCTHFDKVRRLCACKRRTTRHRIVCSCPRGNRRRLCQGNNIRVTVRTHWNLSRRLNRCIRIVKQIRRRLNCSKRRWTTLKCRGCRGVKYLHHYRMRNCSCVRKTTSRKVRCCCPKQKRIKRCIGNQWVVERIKYKLRKGFCNKTVNRKRIAVICKRKRTRHSRCKGCIIRHETRYYKIRGCKCIMSKRSVRTSRCCCPKRRRFTQCRARAGILRKVKEVWHLRSGKCIKKQAATEVKVICVRRSVKAYACNRKTRHQRVVITKEVRRGCRCVPQRRVRHILCRCRHPFTRKEKCGRKARRRVFRITYKLLRLKGRVICKLQRRLLYSEPCRCRKTERRLKCSAGGKVLMTIIRSWSLCTSHGRKICALSVRVLRNVIRCKNKSIRWTPCKRFRKIRITVHHRPVNCKCRSKSQKRVFACNCAKKSFKRHYCDHKSGSIVTVHKSYFSRRGAASCSVRSRKTHKPVSCCNRKRYTRLSRKCSLSHHHGWYTKYLVTWQVRIGCTCIHRRKKIKKLCRCRRNSTRTKCSRSGRHHVTIRHTYKRIGSICKLIRTEQRRLVMCSRKSTQIRFHGCSKCKRQVSLTQCFVRSCRKRRYMRSGLQRCCTPSERKHRYCNASKGRWVTVIIKYRLVPSGPLLKDRNGRVRVLQFKVASRRIRHFVNIVCPKSKMRESCNRRSGHWRKTKTSWRRIGCRCKKTVRRWSGRCRCPTKQVRWSRCNKRYKIRTVISFKLKHHKCVRGVHKRRYLCACPKRRVFTVCDRRGRWRTCHVNYLLQFRRQRCVKNERCRSRKHTCTAPREIRGRCIRLSRIIKRYVWRLDKRRCRCKRTIYTRRAECNCYRRNHSRTMCKHGAFVTRIFRYKQRGERCVRSMKIVTRPVNCDRRRKTRFVRGSCIKVGGRRYSGYQKLLVEWQVNQKCKCVRKHTVRWVPCVCRLIKRFATRKSVRCVRGTVLRHTTVFYKLQGGRCVQKVDRRNRKIVCVGKKTIRSKCKRNKHGDTYTVTRLLHRVSNGRCGCMWKQRLLRYGICRCRKMRRSKRCLRDRVWRFEQYIFSPVPGTTSCRRRVKRHDRQVHCPKAFRRRTKCRRCSFTVRHFVYKHSKCKCLQRLHRVQHLKCCCPKPITENRCDASRHLKVTVTLSYTLRRHACHLKRAVRTKRVRCRRKRPLYRVFRCRKGFRKISKTVYFEVGCSCRSKNTMHKQQCACTRSRTFRRGKCGRWFAHDVWLAFKLKATGKKIPGTDKPLLRCVRYVAHRRKRRCRCPKSTKRRQCKSHNLIVNVTVSYKLRRNSCERKRVERRKLLPCQARPRLVRVERLPRRCSPRNGFVQVLRYVYVRAKSCRCVHFIRIRRRVCDCLRKYGRRLKKRCVGHKRVITRITWRVPKGYGCTKRSKTYVRIIYCKGKWLKRDRCGRNGLRTYRLYKRYTNNCACKWKLVRRINVPCRCPKTVITRHCLGKHWVRVTKRWRLAGRKLQAHCQLVRRVQKRRVPCKVGRHLTRSRCNVRGVRHFVLTIRSLHKCSCVKQVKRYTCKCRCRKPTTRRFCRKGRVWETIKSKSILGKCGCFTKSSVTRRPVRCSKSRIIRGLCKRGRSGDKYQKLTQIRWHIQNCKCHRKRTVRHRLCGCDKRRKVHRSCRSGFVRITRVSERRYSSGRCRRIQVGLRLHRVRCGRVQVRRVCDKKSGKLSIFVSKPHIKQCRCIRNVTRHTRRCGCFMGNRLVSVGKCNRKSCRQRLLFKKQILSREKCIWRRYHRHRTCCCRGYRRSVTCQHKRGFRVTTITKQVLKHWKCVKKVVVSRKRVKCKRNLTVRKKKLPRGILKVMSCWMARRGCHCVKRCKTVFKRYSCNKPTKRVVCRCSRGRCHQHISITTWRLSRGRCFRQTSRAKRPIRCKSNTSTRSRCNRRTKFGFYYVKRETSWYQKACRCKPKVQTRFVVCHCLRSHRRSFCQRGHVVRINTSYRLTRGRCVKIVKRHSRAVRCRHTWRLSHRTSGSPVFFKVFVRYILSGCRCLRQVRRVPCRSLCRPCSKSRRCERGGYMARIRVCWHLVGCRCVRKVDIKRRRVRCPKPSRTSRCRRCVRTIITRLHTVRRCSCTMRTRVAKSKCCCPKAKITRLCVRGSIRLRRVSHKLRKGRCYSQTKDTYRPVTCSRRISRAIQSKCMRGKQRYTVYYWAKIGCRCVRRVRFEYKKCACARKGVDLFIVVDLFNKNRHGYKKRIMQFVQTISTYFKQTSIRVRTTLIAYDSDVYVRKLKHLRNLPLRAFTKSKTDLYTALREVHKRVSGRSRSGVEKVVAIVTCGKHNKRRKIVTLAEKIKRKASVFVIGVRPIPKSGRYVKWLASKPVKLHYAELGLPSRHRISATSLFERICKRACAKPRVRRSVCHKRTCRRIFTRITFRLDRRNGKCVRKSRSWWKLCCCLKRNSTRTECRKNRMFRVTTKYSFLRHACHRHVRRQDISSRVYAACRPRVSHRKGKCRRDGWRKDTTETRRVISCICRVQRRHHLRRCRCPRSHARSACVKGNRVRQCLIKYRITPSACIPHRSCRSRPVTCRRRRNFRGKCNKSSCRRSMGSVWYTVRNCRCKRHSRSWKEICCCKRKYQRFRYCDKRRNIRVEVQSWYELRGTSCRRVSRKSVRPVRCPKRRVDRSRCTPKRNGFYRIRLESNWRKRNCGCVKHTKSRLELCRCRNGRTVNQCRSGSWVLTRHWLQKVGNRCISRTRVLSRRRVTCSSKRHNRVGRCRHVKGDKRYAQVVQTWKRRVGCSCKTERNIFFKLCACPKPYKRFACHGNSRQVVTMYRYKLHKNRCHLSKSTSHRLVRCPKARTKVSKCRGKTQAVVVILHSAIRCRCVSKEYKRTVRCKAKCRDLLPTKICRKWAANEIQLCEKYPYFAKHLCARTCHQCYGCRKTRVVFAGELCLGKQRGFRHVFHLSHRSSFNRCMRSCRHNHKCRAFDYESATRKCRLLRVNRNGFLVRLPWIKLRKTPGCFLFERICPKKCPFRKIHKQYKCRCLKFGKRQLCRRAAVVATWRRGRSGRCERRLQRMHIPCRRCEDRRRWCKKAKCTKRIVRRFCKFTCGVCKRRPTRFSRRYRCSKAGWQKVIHASTIFNKKLRIWQVRISIKRKRCVRCPVGSYRLVGPCKKGKRKLTKVVAKFVHGKCRVTARSKVKSCKGCNLTKKQMIGKCKRRGHRWTRTVVTLFTLRRAGRCVVSRSVVVFSCSPKCPKNRVSRSPCKCGRRIRCVHYFVTYHGSKLCIPRRYTTSEACVSRKRCHDRLRPVDCLFAKKTKMCRSMRNLCSKTCGFCR